MPLIRRACFAHINFLCYVTLAYTCTWSAAESSSPPRPRKTRTRKSSISPGQKPTNAPTPPTSSAHSLLARFPPAASHPQVLYLGRTPEEAYARLAAVTASYYPFRWGLFYVALLPYFDFCWVSVFVIACVCFYLSWGHTWLRRVSCTQWRVIWPVFFQAHRPRLPSRCPSGTYCWCCPVDTGFILPYWYNVGATLFFVLSGFHTIQTVLHVDTLTLCRPCWMASSTSLRSMWMSTTFTRFASKPYIFNCFDSIMCFLTDIQLSHYRFAACWPWRSQLDCPWEIPCVCRSARCAHRWKRIPTARTRGLFRHFSKTGYPRCSSAEQQGRHRYIYSYMSAFIKTLLL